MKVTVEGNHISLGASVSVYRHWRNKECPHSDTYRYFGAHYMLSGHWWQLRVGWHVDLHGRLYVYLGKLCLWQDIVRCRGRRQWLKSTWLGPIEFVFNREGKPS